MLRDADPRSFSGIYLVCGFTDMRYGIDTLAAIIENRYHLKLFVPGTLFLFCGKRANKTKDWVNVFSKDGAYASSVIYSVVETAKANALNVNAYLEYLLSELSAHADEPKQKVISRLLLWSKEVKKLCTKPPQYDKLISRSWSIRTARKTAVLLM